MLQSPLGEKEGTTYYLLLDKSSGCLLCNTDESTTMKQLSIQQEKQIDQLKTTMAEEKEGNNIIDMYSTLYISSVLENELMSERLKLKATLKEKEGK